MSALTAFPSLIRMLIQSDGVGVVIDAGSPELVKKWKGKRVMIVPFRGWESDPDGPDGVFESLGGTHMFPKGTFTETLVLSESGVVEIPGSLSDPSAASLPLAGLTAYRAVFSKGNLKAGQNVLITGIGGGVALFALQFAIAAGARSVWVSSSSEEKIKWAVEKYGADGGVNYKTDPQWHKTLQNKLPKDRPLLDLIIDGAGGNIISQGTGITRVGGKIVVYGMTAGPVMKYSMVTVLKNIDVLGSTMGSKAELKQMLDFVEKHKIQPIVSKVFEGLENADPAFEQMKNGNQFGKLVITIRPSGKL